MNKKEEAILRLKLLKIDNKVVEEFNNDTLYISNEFGDLCKLNKICKETISYLEKKNLLIYHILKTKTNFGIIYSFLYISNSEEDWEYERPTEKYVAAYCYNQSIPEYSEFGDIFFEVINGKITRLN